MTRRRYRHFKVIDIKFELALPLIPLKSCNLEKIQRNKTKGGKVEKLTGRRSETQNSIVLTRGGFGVCVESHNREKEIQTLEKRSVAAIEAAAQNILRVWGWSHMLILKNSEGYHSKTATLLRLQLLLLLLVIVP